MPKPTPTRRSPAITAVGATGIAFACTVAVLPPRASADTAIPDGIIGPVVGITWGVGTHAAAMPTGIRYGMEAGWQPMSVGQRIGLGIHWVASGAYHLGIAETAGNVGGSLPLQTFSLEGTLRLRWAIGNRGWYGHVGGGGGLFRSNLALPPDETRSYWGGTAEAGVNYLFARRGYATFNLALSGIPAPTTANIMLGVVLAM